MRNSLAILGILLVLGLTLGACSGISLPDTKLGTKVETQIELGSPDPTTVPVTAEAPVSSAEIAELAAQMVTLQARVDFLVALREQDNQAWAEAARYTDVAYRYYAMTTIVLIDEGARVGLMAQQVADLVAFDHVLSATWEGVRTGDMDGYLFDLVLHERVLQKITDAIKATLPVTAPSPPIWNGDDQAVNPGT